MNLRSQNSLKKLSNITQYHAKYFSHELTKRCPSDSLEKLSATLSNAQVDLNPHQIEAALFAFKSPLSKGAILADEVGLGKTIEAGLVLSQKWAEHKRKILLITPSSLRKQWSSELQEKFFLPSIILEAKSFNEAIKEGNLNPLNQENAVIICSYHFAKSKAPYIKKTEFDLVVIDEAHRLRNVYKTSSKIAREIKDAIQEYPKLLLTATPLQNSLLELYGLVSIIDEHVFGDLNSFKSNYSKNPFQEIEGDETEPKQDSFLDLRNRLKPVCKRTLRRQVLEYINYRDRKPITQDYSPSAPELELYEGMSEYLQRPTLYALPFSQRQLITLILRKLLASSSFAIANTLKGLALKLEDLEEKILQKHQTSGVDFTALLEENYDGFEQTVDEWIDDEDEQENKKEKKNKEYTLEDIPFIRAEKEDLKKFANLAASIFKNSKGESLLIALRDGFKMTQELGAQKKAVIFTESRITQNYLLELLGENGYGDKILFFNGSNNDAKSKEIYANWLKKNKDSDKITGSKTADLRAALVDYFKSDAEIMIATEAAAEGINLQFCSLVINYDLPWNPQRIEQRIGRCHRYGQKHDVVVVNFVNLKNAADKRVYELLDQKFKLFKGVFGASDEVLGAIESGVDFEKRIAAIYQSCRSEEEINQAFDELQKEMDSSIQEGIKSAKEKLLENFDSDVHEKLKINLKESKAYLETYEKWLWDVSCYFLGDKANYDDGEYSFTLKSNPFPNQNIEQGPYKIGKHIEDAHIYRPNHPLAELILAEIKSQNLPNAEVIFDYSSHGQIISPIKKLVGTSGFLQASELTINSFESEDHILLTATNESGEVIEEEIVRKLFSLNAKIGETNLKIANQKLYQEEQNKISKISESILLKNNQFFDDEVEKLDNWAEDMKKSLEIDLKRLDIEIKSKKTHAKKVLILPEKVKLQREIKELEKKRNEARQKLYQAQDKVDEQKEDLLAKIEAKLKQQSELKTLFTVKFRII
jgi:ERCC4-related helicase